MKQFRAIAITHKKAGLDEIGRFHIEDSQLEDRLKSLKNNAGLEELMYISTCNRVEFYFVSGHGTDDDHSLIEFFHSFNPGWGETQLLKAVKLCEYFKGEEAIRHIFNVASSLDSMVIGEREIITQVRTAYENCQKYGLTGDLIRLVMKKTVEAAKEIYTETDIATKPVSVVSLAFRKLRDLNIHENSRILFIGAGQTNTNMARFLKKNSFSNFVVFNRSIANGLALSNELKCEVKELKDIARYNEGFDVIISCTASSEPVITEEIYASLLNGDTHAKIVIDLAVPGDLAPGVQEKFRVKVINVENLKDEAGRNLRERERELERCNVLIEKLISEFREMYRIRQVELAMSEVPQKVKEIKDNAIQSVFAKDIAQLDPHSREVFERVLDYIEKKYISVPMKMAKEIMIAQKDTNPAEEQVPENVIRK